MATLCLGDLKEWCLSLSIVYIMSLVLSVYQSLQLYFYFFIERIANNGIVGSALETLLLAACHTQS